MDDYRVIWIKDNKPKHITAYVGNPTTTDNIDGLSVELRFSVARNVEDINIGVLDIHPGDKVLFLNGKKELFRGIIIDYGLDGSVQANDFGYYLNESSIILQCNGSAADEAIRQMCRKVGVGLGHIESMPTQIRENYIGKTPSEILKDITGKVTAERGIRYRYRIEGVKLCVREYPKKPILAGFQPAGNLPPEPITKALGAVSGSESMAGLRNSVTVYLEKDDNARILATASDKATISKYGWLQHTENVDEKNTAQAKNISSTMLKQLNVITQEYRIDNILGSDDVVSGVMLRFDEKLHGIAGDFIVTQVTHNYTPVHTMSLEVQKKA